MKKICTVILLTLQAVTAWTAPDQVKAAGTIDACFTPGENCTGKIAHEIDQARNEVLVQAYSFTSKPIAKALLGAHKRGVKVEAVLDKSQRKERYTSATFLSNAGIPVFIDGRHAIAHNKVIVIDRRTVITGSFNFTKAAQERNAENLLIIEGSRALVEKYLANYAAHREHSEPYAVR